MASTPVAIVTGASSGIGLALTQELLKKGYRVAMADVNAKMGEAKAEELGSPESVCFYRADVSSWDEQAAVFQHTYHRWGRVDFFAGNAGIDDKENLYGATADPAAPDVPIKPNMKAIEVNLLGVVYGVRLAMHYFRMNKVPGGKIVLTSSDSGLYPLIGCPQYTATKHAVVGLTRSMGSVLAKENIFINAVLPAFVPTGLAPPGLIDAWPKEHITPMSTIMKAFAMFLDSDMSGQTGECSLQDVFLRKQPEYPNESQRWIHEEGQTVWDTVYPS